MKSIFLKEWKVMIRDRTFLWSGIGFLILSTVAQVHGILSVKRMEADQEIRIRATRDSHELYLQEAKDGKLKFGSHLYKARIPFVFDVPPGASLSLSALEETPRGLDVSLKAFVPQIFTPPYLNPFRPASGVLDYCGVLSFYLPLWVLGLCFNFHSKEEELGTLRQLQAEGLGTFQLLFPKAVLTFGVIAGLGAAVTLIAGFTARPALGVSGVLSLVMVQSLYGFVWTAIGTGIACLKLPTSRSALLALTSWIVINWLFPAVLTLRSNSDFHEQNVRLLSEHRSALNHYWDQPKSAPLAAFVSPPDWVRLALENAGEAFSWGWYYSMQEATDERFREEFDRNRAGRSDLRTRMSRSSMNGLFENSLDSIVGLGPAHQDFQMERVRTFRAELLGTWVPRMIPDQEVAVEEIRSWVGKASSP